MVPFSHLCLTCTQLDSDIGGGGLSYWIYRAHHRPDITTVVSPQLPAPAGAVSIVAVETALHLSAYFAVPLLSQSLRGVYVHRRLQLSLLNNSRAAEPAAPAALRPSLYSH